MTTDAATALQQERDFHLGSRVKKSTVEQVLKSGYNKQHLHPKRGNPISRTILLIDVSCVHLRLVDGVPV